ncbi:GtrA family protein [Streptomyces sp. NPDC046821]|uniref:GtrA family protein n=1 Tax=Streptomyces sp. NPDC046821 TaxID=3154702 RepID=UPI0033C44941
MEKDHPSHSHAMGLAKEIVKFGAVGGAGVFVNIAAFNLLRHFGHFPVVRASVIATLISIAFNYVGFRYFTYRDRKSPQHTKEISLFLAFSAIGLVIENSILYVATYGFGWDSTLQSNIFKFLGIGVATLFRFWSYRTWVFKALPALPEEQPEPASAGVREGSARDIRRP